MKLEIPCTLVIAGIETDERERLCLESMRFFLDGVKIDAIHWEFELIQCILFLSRQCTDLPYVLHILKSNCEYFNWCFFGAGQITDTTGQQFLIFWPRWGVVSLTTMNCSIVCWPSWRVRSSVFCWPTPVHQIAIRFDFEGIRFNSPSPRTTSSIHEVWSGFGVLL